MERCLPLKTRNQLPVLLLTSAVPRFGIKYWLLWHRSPPCKPSSRVFVLELPLFWDPHHSQLGLGKSPLVAGFVLCSVVYADIRSPIPLGPELHNIERRLCHLPPRQSCGKWYNLLVQLSTNTVLESSIPWFRVAQVRISSVLEKEKHEVPVPPFWPQCAKDSLFLLSFCIDIKSFSFEESPHIIPILMILHPISRASDMKSVYCLAWETT